MPPARYDTLANQYASPLNKMRLQRGETFNFLGGTYLQNGTEPTVQLPDGSVLTSVVMTYNRASDDPAYRQQVYLWAIPVPSPDSTHDFRYTIVRLGQQQHAELAAQSQ